MKRLGSIYKVENNLDGKCYVGQTNSPVPFNRLKELLAEAKRGNNLPLHRAIRVNGVENFTFQILESNIPLEDLDSREIFYIDKLNSFYPNGYNLTRGGQEENKNYKLTEGQVHEIIDKIKQGDDFRFLSEEYGVNYSTISDINCGDTWHFTDETYPIRDSRYKKKDYSNETILEIYECLRTCSKLIDVAKKFDTSIQTIRRINLGELYHHDGIDYPIYKTKSRGKTSSDVVECIVFDIINSDLSLNDIARRYNVERHTVYDINKGTRFLPIIESLGFEYFPLRD